MPCQRSTVTEPSSHRRLLIAGTASGSFGLLFWLPWRWDLRPRCYLALTRPPAPLRCGWRSSRRQPRLPNQWPSRPTGARLAYVATLEGQSRLWLRSLESGLSRAVPGTDGAEFPFWSPDSQSIAFFADAKLRHVAVDGGSVQTLVNATWRRAEPGTRTMSFCTRLWGHPSPASRPRAGNLSPCQDWLDRGVTSRRTSCRMVVAFSISYEGLPKCAAFTSASSTRRSRLAVSSIPTQAPSSPHPDTCCSSSKADSLRRPSIRTAWSWPVSPSLLRRACLAIRAIPSPFRVPGPSRTVGVQQARTGSSSGSIGPARKSARSATRSRRVFRNRRFQPDGHHVAFYRGVSGNPDIWLLDLRRGAFSRFTSDPADDFFPVWSPDGSRIIFSSNRRGTHELYQKPVAGDRSEEVLLSTGQPVSPTDWSRDGRIVLFTSRDPKTGFDIWALPLDGKPLPIVQTAFDEQAAQFAPDGHWIAYQSNESGVAEVYVRPFPGPGERLPSPSAVARKCVGGATGRNSFTSRGMAG